MVCRFANLATESGTRHFLSCSRAAIGLSAGCGSRFISDVHLEAIGPKLSGEKGATSDSSLQLFDHLEV